jgi:DNA helicase-2/ATP-dependent DNA helicase PcrA
MTARLILTPEQQAVVDHPPEPLRVAAGAGTGKTATVVERLATAVEGGIAPEEALGITFTNKAAEELADRLRGRMPAHAADGREVEVDTYHGFALRILREFGAVIGVERDLTVVGAGYVRQLLHESIGTEVYDHLEMTALSQRLDEAATLGAQAAANLVDAPAIAAAAPADPDEVWLARVDLARILSSYEATKRRLGVVDFGDLVHLAYRVVDRNPELAARIRARYRVVVLDEYQDTDPGQRMMLQAIFGHGFPITAVGDGDQTIYEWRGASLANFTGFGAHFLRSDGEPAHSLPLTTNRRSGPTILAVANAVKDLLHEGAGTDPLVPAEVVPDHVGYGWFRTAADEAAWIAEEIRRLHDEDGIRWRDIAVLFRRHRSIAPVRTALAAADIPHEVVSMGGLIEVPEVADVHAWLRILAAPDDSVALARILLGSRYRLGLGDLAPLARWVRHRHGGDSDPDLAIPYPMLEAVDRGEGDSPPEVAGVLDEFRDTYRSLLAAAQQCTLVELIRRVIDAIDGWTEIEAMPEVAGLTARLNLYRFLDLAEDWSPLAGRPSVEGFLGYLDLLSEEQNAAELDTATVGGEDAVPLLTVHRAKGLEWHTVFIPALAAKVFPGRSFGFDNPMDKARWLPYELRLDTTGLPDLTGKKTEVTEGFRDHHRRSELRTAYVAVTRAQRRLIMTGAVWDRRRTAYTESELLTLVRKVPGAHEIEWVDDPGERPDDMTSTTGVDGPDPHFPSGWRAKLLEVVERDDGDLATDAEPARRQLELMLDGLPAGPPAAPPQAPTTSVTGLVTLASCPRRFYWTEIDPLPRRPGAWLRRGSEVHRRIELHHMGVRPFDDLEPDAPPTAEVAGEAGDVSGEPFAAFSATRFAAMKPRLTETPIDLTVSGVRVRGRIDAVFEPEPGWWEIIDWKTGRRSDDPTAVVQLEAYAVAAARGGVVGVRPERITAGFVYLGSDPADEVTHEADEAWLTAAGARLEALAAQVTGDRFEPTPGDGCRRCDFLNACAEGRRHVAAAAGA